jgi:hypothetical protein
MLQQRKVCDTKGCNKDISNQNGITVHGNIYTTQLKEEGGGLIGDNFKDVKLASDVHATDMCAKCFLDAMTKEFKDEIRKELSVPVTNKRGRKPKEEFDISKCVSLTNNAPLQVIGKEVPNVVPPAKLIVPEYMPMSLSDLNKIDPLDDM